MKSVKKGTIVISVIAVLALLLVAVGCNMAATPAGAEKASAADVKKEEKKVVADLYDFKPRPLHSVAECAQCHVGVFERIKDVGGKHQIECVECHTQFHMFNPKKMDPKVYELQEGEKLWTQSLDLLKTIDPQHEAYSSFIL